MTERPLTERPLPVVRVLRPTDVSPYFALRLALLRSDPLAYVTTAEEWAGRRLADVAGRLGMTEHHVTYGAYLGSDLAGILTLLRESRTGLAHRTEIVSVGVLPAFRGQGCADALLRSAIAQARRWEGAEQIDLSVTETQHAALRLYRRWGFVTWGVQPGAVRGPDGSLRALHHLTLKL